MGKKKRIIWGFKIGIPVLLIVLIISGISFFAFGIETKERSKAEKHGNTDATEITEATEASNISTNISTNELDNTERIIATLYMPDLIGASEEGAIKKLKDMGFYNVKTKHESSSDYEKGFVFKQSIPANTTVGTDFEITLHVSE
jgi:preprotein translocase subunit SecF